MRKEFISVNSTEGIVDHDMKIWSQKYTFVIFLMILAIYFAYQTKTLKSIPCENGILNGIYRSFVHISTKHLLANLAGIYLLYRAEVQIGSESFLRVFSSILIMSVVLEVMYGLIFGVQCSIGFSGVLFGFAAWSICTERDMDYSLLALFVGLMMITSVGDPKVSLSGHISGFIVGMITALYMGKVQKQPLHKLASF
jgi:hypothetical protein